MKTKILKIASCLCGGIKLKTRGKHRYIINCHCMMCMKFHGHYAAYTSIKEKNIIFICKKTLKWYRSSKSAKRGFCSICGSSLFFKRLNSENISIAAGIFNNPTKLKWQKKHEENLTGTTKAHKPDGSLAFDSKNYMKKY